MTDPHAMFRTYELAKEAETDAARNVLISKSRYDSDSTSQTNRDDFAADLIALADAIEATVEAETVLHTATTYDNPDGESAAYSLFGRQRAQRLKEAARHREMAESLTRG
ncbi:MAG: hypothetical protein J0I34_07325 [Pseudonocardia sp.]|uniref:hypothetical protein n=1 Tax=Actinomycetes TaxID=1760 RepID=UPI00086A3724|nr:MULTISPECIES: hypothetical protein [Actinomycetes]MBN9108578.1 hypothetical protein [Pseudonocardia sp.]ODU27457.1 MAG: hypothetical protein ABS80_03510 [Pseudonocardia sp. SCN 72-51]ODV07781.1 MAG: hypothetical protein ABT15_06810 [Pseudonocardia sp. SCN 73-27]